MFNKSDIGHSRMKPQLKKKYRSGFCQSILTCYREKEKEEDKNYKAIEKWYAVMCV